MKFKVSGFINKNIEISSKSFNTIESANSYLEKILNKYDVQIEEIYENDERTNLVVNNYSRLFIERI